jgi:P pilus assembly chaperone PapD
MQREFCSRLLAVLTCSTIAGACLFGPAVASYGQTTTAPPPEPRPAAASPEAPAAGAAGVGDLLVAPTRVILEGRTRTAELALVNIGSQPATFRISLIHMQMTPDGNLKEIEKPGPEEDLADSLIRFSPRQVTLQPTVVQTIRVSLRVPENLAPGEYRTHLLFRGVPPPDTAPPIDPQKTETEGFRIRLTPIYGVSIPLIVRHGDTSAKATLSDVKLDLGRPEADGGPAVQLKVNRTGNRSVYGNLTARFTPKGGKEQVVGLVNGIAVYTPLPSRSTTLPLHPPAGVNLANGRLRVSYVDAEQTAGGTTLAEAELAVP